MAERIRSFGRIKIITIIALGIVLLLLGLFTYKYWDYLDPLVQFSYDFDKDGIKEEGILKDNQVVIKKGGSVIFQSDPEWKVKEILVGDFDNEGGEDFALSLWKKGKYGSSTPFWVDENDNTYRMHLFVYTFKEGSIKALWHSSDLDKENLRVRLFDIDNDKRKELVVLEKEYDSIFPAPKYFSIWRWNEWGFELIERESVLKF